MGAVVLLVLAWYEIATEATPHLLSGVAFHARGTGKCDGYGEDVDHDAAVLKTMGIMTTPAVVNGSKRHRQRGEVASLSFVTVIPVGLTIPDSVTEAGICSSRMATTCSCPLWRVGAGNVYVAGDDGLPSVGR